MNEWIGSGTILVVDDDKNIRELCSIMLRQFGYQVILAENGREAVEVFRNRHPEIVCVVLDLSMPVMDGNQAFEIMTKINPDVRVLVMSGSSQRSVIGKFTEKQPAGVIEKPFLPTTLLEMLKGIV